MPSGYSLSLLMHIGLLLVMVFGLPILFPQERDMTPSAMTVEIVPIKEFTNLKNSKRIVKEPAPAPKTAKPVPKTRTEPKQPEPKPDAVPLPKEQPKPKEVKKPEPKKPEIKPKPKEEEDDFAVLMSKLKQQDSSEKPDKKADKKAEDGGKSKSENYDPTIPLSMSETDAIRSQISRNWRMPGGARGDYSLLVTLRIQLMRNGTVQDVGLVPSQISRYQSDTFFRAAVDSAIRAVHASSPLKGLPLDKYDTWRDFEVNFDPRDALY